MRREIGQRAASVARGILDDRERGTKGPLEEYSQSYRPSWNRNRERERETLLSKHSVESILYEAFRVFDRRTTCSKHVY